MKKWLCTVCNYVHEGETPPDECPVCGVGPEMFEEIKDEQEQELMTAEEKRRVSPVTRKITYGLFVIGSIKEDKINAQTANTAFQITSDPVRIAVGINKNNLTWEYINESRVFSVSILGQQQIDMAKHFGFQSGRKTDKFADVAYETGQTGAPLLAHCLGRLECRVEQQLDVGSHTIFVGQVVGGALLEDAEPLTYAAYHKNK